MSEWNFDPPEGIADREVGLASILKKLRYDLTGMQGKITEALRIVATLDLDEANEHTSFMNGPVTADHCPQCGVGGGFHAADCVNVHGKTRT